MENEENEFEKIDKRKQFYRQHIKEMADSIDELDVLIYFDNYIFKLLEIKKNEKQGN